MYMAKSAIYVVNTSVNLIAVGGSVPLGSAIHGFGCGIKLKGSEIDLDSGYYSVDAVFGLTATAVGTTTITLQIDGRNVAGASVSFTSEAVGDTAVLIVPPAMLRVAKCCGSSISFVVSGTGANITSDVVRVVQI